MSLYVCVNVRVMYVGLNIRSVVFLLRHLTYIALFLLFGEFNLLLCFLFRSLCNTSR